MEELRRCRCGGAQVLVESDHGGPIDCGEPSCALDESYVIGRLVEYRHIYVPRAADHITLNLKF